MAERLERATHNPQTLLSWVRVRFTVRADTCLVWDRWLYPVSRATRYTLFQAPDRAKATMRWQSITRPVVTELCEKCPQNGLNDLSCLRGQERDTLANFSYEKFLPPAYLKVVGAERRQTLG